MPEKQVQSIPDLKAKALMQRISTDLKAHPSFEGKVKPEMHSLIQTLFEKHA